MEGRPSGLLRLVSRKVLPPSGSGPNRKPSPAVKKTWLQRTVDYNGSVRFRYRPLIRALAGLEASNEILKTFNSAVTAHDIDKARQLWRDVLETPPSREPMTEWKSLTAKFGNHGPQSFASALNKISRQYREDPGLVSDLVLSASAQNSSLSPYIVGTVLEQLASKDPGLASTLFNAVQAAQNKGSQLTSHLGIDALLYGAKAEPAKVVELITRLEKVPGSYRVPTKIVTLLGNHANSVDCVTATRLLAPHMNVSAEYDRLLRRLYTNSDEGAELVEQLALKRPLPATLYPFIVKRLCERIVKAGDARRKEQTIRRLDQLFDGPLLELAGDSPGMLLHLLIIRTIAIEGVAATAPILNKWQESDKRGVSGETWMLLFTTFRRSGHPDKCLEILSRTLREQPRVSMQVVSEYLHFTAHYYHLHVYLEALVKVVPEITPTLEFLGISEYAKNLADPMEPPLCQLKPQLTAANRAFSEPILHESWLVATYNAVLSTVESIDEAMDLFQRYLAYAEMSGSATSLKVTDHFVVLLTSKIGGPAALDAAVHIFEQALGRLNLQLATDGRNHAKSLEVLCYRLTLSGQIDRAIKLLLQVSEHPRGVIRGSALQPMLGALPGRMRESLAEWADRMGASVSGESLDTQDIEEAEAGAEENVRTWGNAGTPADKHGIADTNGIADTVELQT